MFVDFLLSVCISQLRKVTVENFRFPSSGTRGKVTFSYIYLRVNVKIRLCKATQL